MSRMDWLATWVLKRIDPEQAHEIAIKSIALGLAGRASPDSPLLKTEIFGHSFKSPVGLAAGFDKNARALRGLARLGFGYIEAGTVTPRPQDGNPKPRLFRMTEDAAIINRMGFNNCGIDIFCQNLAKIFRPDRQGHVIGAGVPLGINLGINKLNADPLRDYPALVQRVKNYADYITINLSSPNTPGLRDLQGPGMLSRILDNINENCPDRPPLLVKLAPDLSNESYASIVEAACQHGADGLVLTNTTLSRSDSLIDSRAFETGGLSGRPLANRARSVLQIVARQNKGRLKLVSVGGIETGRDVFERLHLGADLVQIYTTFIFHGPAALQRIKKELLRTMQKAGATSIADIRNKPLPRY